MATNDSKNTFKTLLNKKLSLKKSSKVFFQLK